MAEPGTFHQTLSATGQRHRPAPAKSDDLRDRNRSLVLAAVRRGRVVSRTELGQRTGLSAATVSAITSDFLAEGVLRSPDRAKQKPEPGHAGQAGQGLVEPKRTGKKQTDSKKTGQKQLGQKQAGRGRPTVDLELNGQAALVCAVYFKLNLVAARLVDYRGQTVQEYSSVIDGSNGMNTDSNTDSGTLTAADIRAAIIDSVDCVLRLAGTDHNRLSRIGVGFQGVTDVEGRTVLWTPLSGERNMAVPLWLEEHFGVPAHVANDCDMAAIALNWRDPERYGENFAAVLLAHGIGMGLFLHDTLVNGTGSSAVEFGHMTYIPDGALCLCGNKGCIEAYAGNYAIDRHASGKPPHVSPGSPAPGDLERTGEAARNGDSQALEAIETAGRAIGTGLANLFALVDPFPVVLAGNGAALFDLMEAPMREALRSAPNQSQATPVTIDCYTDEIALVLEGCATRALLMQDQMLANRHSRSRAVSTTGMQARLP